MFDTIIATTEVLFAADVPHGYSCGYVNTELFIGEKDVQKMNEVR